MEERLRKEQYDIEVANQKLAAELKASKASQLDDMAAQVRRELAALEKSRLDMEMDMTRKQLEIEALQKEVRDAEASLMEEDKAKHARFAGILSFLCMFVMLSIFVTLANISSNR